MKTEPEACPAPEALANWANGSVDDDTRADLVRHSEGCESCREAIALLAQMRTGDDEPAPRTNSEVVAEKEPALLPGPGDRLGRFRIEKVLGRGGMGVVLLAHDEQLDRDVALKLPRAEGGARARLRKEARALAALRHPNLVAVHEVGEEDGQPFLVMELVRGHNLRAHVATKQPTWRDTLTKCVEAASGVAALHAAGFVHRDLKPDNVMLAEDGRVLVVDLGLAQRLDDVGAKESALTRTGAIVGTPRYLAPERVAGAGASVASDVYALAAMTLELVRASSGKPPERLIGALTRALDPDPRQRPASAAALAREIEQSLAAPRRLWIGLGVACLTVGAVAMLSARGPTPIAMGLEANLEATSVVPASEPSAAPSLRVPSSLAPSASAPTAPAPSALAADDPVPSAAVMPSVEPTMRTTASLLPTAEPQSQPAPTIAPTTSAPLISGSAAAAALSAAGSSGWIQIDPRPMPSLFSREWMQRMDWPPRTFEVGYAKIMDRYSPCDSKPEPEALPRGLDWGPIEKKGVVETVSPTSGPHKELLVMVNGQRGRVSFVGLNNGTYLDAEVGDWVLLRSAPASRDRLPAGWEATKEYSYSEFAPIAGAPAWAAKKPRPEHLPCGPMLKSASDDLFEKERIWPHAEGPYLFVVTSPPSTPLADGPARAGSFMLEAPSTVKNVELLDKATANMPIWVIARFSRIASQGDWRYAVMTLDEVLPRLVDPPKSK